MISLRRAWRQRLVAAATLGSLLVACGFALVWWALRDMLETQEIRELSRVSAVGAAQLEAQVDTLLKHARHFGGRADERAPGGDGAGRRALDALRSEHGGLLAAAVESDSQGGVVAASPASWPGAAAAANWPTTRMAKQDRILVLSPEVVVIQERRFAHVAAPLPQPAGGDGEDVHVLSLLIDLDALQERFLDPLCVQDGDVGLLVAADGELLGAANGPRNGEVAVQGLSSELRENLAVAVAGGQLSMGGVVEVAGTAYLMSAVAPVRLAGRMWRLLTLRPRAAISKAAKPLLLACSLFGLLALAGGGAMVAGLRRSAEALAEARRDAAHWRTAATEARREDRWRIIAEEAHEPIVFLDGARVVAGNRGAVEALDLGERHALLGQDFMDFVAREDRDALSRRIQGVGGLAAESVSFRARFVTARGRQRVVDLVLSSIETAEGRLVRVSWQDLTSRERAEALLRSVVRSAPFSVVLTDRDGRLVWANQAFQDACHYPTERFVGHELLPIVDPRDRRRARVLIARAARGRQNECVLHMRRTDGELLAVAVRATPVYVGSELYGIVLIGFDAAAAPAFAGWERIPDGVLLAQLGTLLAHRLSNDLQGLVGIVEHLEGAPELTAEARRLVANATRQLQQFSVLSRSGTASLQPHSLGGLVEAWRQRVEDLLPRGTRLVTRRSVQEDTIRADAGQITLLLDLALTSVAPELAGGGSLEVAIEPSPVMGALRLSIFDTSPGTPERAGAASPSLLVRPARDMVRAVARLVARHHGGFTGFKSSVGIGNRLWCDLLVSAESSPPVLLTGAPLAGAVLVADDEELVRRTLAESLRELGHQVVEASNGAEVVELVLAEPERFALVVLDLVMPVLDGREALRQIRARLPLLPVMLCTGYDPSGDPVLATAEVMIKPFGIDEFVARVGELLHQPGRRVGGDGRMHA